MSRRAERFYGCSLARTGVAASGIGADRPSGRRRVASGPGALATVRVAICHHRVGLCRLRHLLSLPAHPREPTAS